MTQTETSLSLYISQIVQLTANICCYQLKSSSGDELPLITPGSYLEIQVQTDIEKSGKTEYHSCFICSKPAQRDFYEIVISVGDKNHRSSRLISEHFHIGTQLDCKMPGNNFQLHADSSPTILLAEEIGIAPIKAIAQTLAMRGRRFALHYAGHYLNGMAFVDELQTDFTRQVQFYPADKNANMDILQILADAPGNAFFYACGSQKMLEEIEVNARMLGIASDRIQCEYFDSEKTDLDKPVVLELAYSDKLINVPADQPLLAVLRDANIDVNFDCCVGDCGTCAVKILEGEADHRDHVLSDDQKAQGFMCLCVSRAKSDKLLLAL